MYACFHVCFGYQESPSSDDDWNVRFKSVEHQQVKTKPVQKPYLMCYSKDAAQLLGLDPQECTTVRLYSTSISFYMLSLGVCVCVYVWLRTNGV